jgi:hypothetical protein
MPKKAGRMAVMLKEAQMKTKKRERSAVLMVSKWLRKYWWTVPWMSGVEADGVEEVTASPDKEQRVTA